MSGFDILPLTFLRPATDKDDEAISILAEVNPITRAKINPELVNAGPDTLGVRQVSLLDARQSRCDLDRRFHGQTIGPSAKRTPTIAVKVLANFDRIRW